MPRIVVTATIPAGQSISNAVDLSAGDASFCHMPSGWTPALLSFLISYDGNTYGDLVDRTAREITLNLVPGTVIQAVMLPARTGWLKFRSGSRFGPVIQTASRTFTIIGDTSQATVLDHHLTAGTA